MRQARTWTLSTQEPFPATIRRAATFLALFLALVFVVTLANQTAQLVQLASRLHPAAGEATLWGLIFLYVACLGVPVVLGQRLPVPSRCT